MNELPIELFGEIISHVNRFSLFALSQTTSLGQLITLNDYDQFVGICKDGNLLNIIHSPYDCYIYINAVLYNACKGGQKELVEIVLEELTYGFSYAFYSACENGNHDIKELIINRFASHCSKNAETIDWNATLTHACKEVFNYENYHSLIKALIEKGATRCNNCNKSIEEHI